MIQAQCHCGNIQLTIPHVTETGTRCNCSICSRYATIRGYFKEKEVKVSVGEYNMDSYIHGDKMIDFKRCAKCGCITHYISTTPGPDSTVAVNYRLFGESLLQKVKVRDLDGADTWQYID